jgi:hypothetical protein
MINYQIIGLQKLTKSINNIFFQELFPAFRSKSSFKKVFSKPKKELPAVALFSQEKLPFFTAGFPLQSGLGHPESPEL